MLYPLSGNSDSYGSKVKKSHHFLTIVYHNIDFRFIFSVDVESYFVQFAHVKGNFWR